LSDAAAAFGEPHREISFHPIEGGAILFDALRRRLYALNPAAGLTWLCIRDGLSQLEAIRAIAEGLGVDEETAADWCRTSTDMFREFHLLDESAPETPLRSGSRQGELRARLGGSGETLYFAILDRTVSVCAPVSLQAGILSLLGLLRVAEPSQANSPADRISVDVTVIDGDRWEIAVDGYAEAVCGIGSVVAELERVIVEAVVPATPHVLTLHAASLQHRGHTVLLAGPSGSGKTTLSVALAHAGWTFGGDEIVLMEAGGNFRPLPLPACIKADTFPLVSGWFPVWRKCRLTSATAARSGSSPSHRAGLSASPPSSSFRLFSKRPTPRSPGSTGSRACRNYSRNAYSCPTISTMATSANSNGSRKPPNTTILPTGRGKPPRNSSNPR
jgi:hypothetical protein